MTHPSLDWVSRETEARLQAYVDLLTTWSPRINLVSAKSLASVWTRHIADSAQLYPLAPKGFTHWADLGSGGGLPGLVIAILALEQAPAARITLVESDSRKCAFLATAARTLAPNVHVETARIETLAPLAADVISARALAPLAKLLPLARRHAHRESIGLFPKGASVDNELTALPPEWHSRLTQIPSRTGLGAQILRIDGLGHGSPLPPCDERRQPKGRRR